MDFRRTLRDTQNAHPYTNDITTPPNLAHKGRLYMALTQRAFDETDGPFGVSFVHSMMHAAGAIGRGTKPVSSTSLIVTTNPIPFTVPIVTPITTTKEVPLDTAGEHDLTWMDKKLYDAIINNCAKK